MQNLLPYDFYGLSNSATCVVSANPLRPHCLDKVVKALASPTSMNRDD